MLQQTSFGSTILGDLYVHASLDAHPGPVSRLKCVHCFTNTAFEA